MFQQPVGVPHTVFSRDLPGEYWAFNHKTTRNEADLSVLASNSPELGFVASLEEDGKRKPREESHLVLIVPVASPTLIRSHWIQQPAVVDPNSRWLPYSRSLRAPPQPVSL
jgi:hypothetical protein